MKNCVYCGRSEENPCDSLHRSFLCNNTPTPTENSPPEAVIVESEDTAAPPKDESIFQTIGRLLGL
jgi:hypothetical protein